MPTEGPEPVTVPIPVPRGGAAAQSWFIIGPGASAQKPGLHVQGSKAGDSGDTGTMDRDGDIPPQQAAPGRPKARRNCGLSSHAVSQVQDAGTI